MNDWLDQIICVNHLDVLADAPDDLIDLTVTSPPYDQMRHYDGYTFNAPKLIAELLRITKPGGVCAWVVGDQIIDGERTLTSFQHAFDFRNQGWRIHDIIIWQKLNTPFPRNNAHTPAHEYIIIAVNGKRPKTSNILTKPAKGNRKPHTRPYHKTPEAGRNYTTKPIPARTQIPRTTIWPYAVGSNPKHPQYQHPAVYPQQLAQDLITTYSNPGDHILDPMNGSGTTTTAAKTTGRHYTGIDTSPQYTTIAQQRTNNTTPPLL